MARCPRGAKCPGFRHFGVPGLGAATERSKMGKPTLAQSNPGQVSEHPGQPQEGFDI